MDAISEERLNQVHPVLSERIHRLSDALAVSGFIIRVTQGIRTVAQQNALYAQGRTTPGPVVTNARGTESNHVLGVAVDVAPMEDGIPDWNASHPDWQRIVSLAPTLGLRDGISWKDEPHLELVEFPSVPTEEAQQIYMDAGVLAVWQTYIP